jgi:hypothetical protein
VFNIIRVTPTPGVSAVIEWTSVPGKTYRVQFKNSLSAPVLFYMGRGGFCSAGNTDAVHGPRWMTKLSLSVHGKFIHV